MSESEALVIRYFRELLSEGNVALTDEILAEDLVYRSPVVTLEGRDAFHEMVLMLRTAFPDLIVAPEPARTARDTVVARFTLTGTHRGEFHRVPPSGRPVSVRGVDTFRIQAGQIQEIREALDLDEILRQLGVRR